MARLKKIVMFSLVQKCNLDVCFQCGLKIETAKELSIEHKQPWLHVDPALFWDLNNIAFSHLKCNIGKTRASEWVKLGKVNPRKIGPEGTSWCIKHKKFLPIELFWNNKANWHGKQHYCKECHHKVRTIKIIK